MGRWNLIDTATTAGQLRITGLVAFVVLMLTSIQMQLDRTAFERYFGNLHPIVLMAAAGVAGVACLGYLMSQGWFEVIGPGDGATGMGVALLVAPPLALVAITADVVWHYPEDTNVLLPDALFFYPSMGFFVEVFLHVVPLAILIALAGRITVDRDALFWVFVAVVVSLEAIFQAVTTEGRPLAIFTGVHLAVFGAAQLYTFRRFGFLPMFAVRLVYYSLWHIAWGWARLRLLF